MQKPLSCLWSGFFVLLFFLAFGVSASAAEEPAADLSILPVGHAPEPVAIPHFPNRLTAFVWRNWNLVPLEKMSETLKTSPENVSQLAAEMGLPEYRKPVWSTGQIYITILRRNWHLLPYEQLLQLLDMTPEKLAFNLREDDFLFHKLGHLKPQCEPLFYAPLTVEEKNETARLKSWTIETLGGAMTQEGEETRFQFIEDLKRVDLEEGNVSEVKSGGESKPVSRFEARYVYSYFAIFGDPLSSDDAELYPDGLLVKLQKCGVNGVWLHVVLRDLAPGGVFPEFGKGHEKRIQNLNKLVQRAKKFGISVYLYMNEPRAMKADFFQVPGREAMKGAQIGEYYSLCTSHPQVRQWLGDSLAFLFREVPDLGGIFTITASENQTNCASHGRHSQCQNCSKRTDAEILAEVNAVMEEGVHRSAPNAKVFVWDWGWRGHQISTDIVEKLPKNVYLQTVSEWSLPLNRGGIPTTVNEYSISAVGPGPRAAAHWEAARKAGLKTSAKVQLGTTWEIASVPYVPALELVAQHCRNLAEKGVSAMMLSWSLGGYPSPNLSMPTYFDKTPIPSVDEVLQTIAKERFGAGAEKARNAWHLISEAYKEFPYGGSVMYTAPTQMGCANLLYPEATRYSATMVGIPYDALNHWRGPFPAEVFASQFAKAAEGILEGAEILREAAELAPETMKKACMQDARYAKITGLHFASTANQANFILLRDALQAGKLTPEEVKSSKKEILKILESEITLAKMEYELCREDSRIGFESTNHYWFVPQDLMEKIFCCRHLMELYAEK